ncbi:MAG: sugar phosphate nucleotidyltransferase [Nanoarchaeota archaeon]
MKEKIAVSLDKALLEELSAAMRGTMLRSRSQAIEYFLRKGLGGRAITVAVILLHRKHHEIALQQVNGQSLVRRQLAWFAEQGIEQVFVLTQSGPLLTRLLLETSKAKVAVEVVEASPDGNAQALSALKDRVHAPFVVMSGDTINSCGLQTMISFHSGSNAVATMGLMDRPEPSRYGSAILDGNRIIAFTEKPRKADSHIVNTGLYVFSPDIFVAARGALSLERDVFPKLAKEGKLFGYFTHGEYAHFCPE